MNKLLELLKQRRIWSALVGVMAFAINALHLTWQIDVPLLTDLLTNFGGAVALLIPAGLALWSFLKPKLPK